MPELPEVETIRRQLEEVLPNHSIINVIVNRPKSLKGDHHLLIGKSIKQIRRFSKLLIIDFYEGVSLAIHLKMTGRLVYSSQNSKSQKVEEDNIDYLHDKHTHITIWIDNGSMHFHDQRTFGYIQILPTTDVENLSYIKNLGPEFFRNLSLKQFVEIVHNSKRAIKTVLLDQQKVAGIGNIYANEALWMAQIHPEQPAATIRLPQSRRLFRKLEDVMMMAIRYGGASSDNYRDATGKKGTVQEHLAVYDRKGNPCQRCGTPIKKYQFMGRGTYICPTCQILPISS